MKTEIWASRDKGEQEVFLWDSEPSDEGGYFDTGTKPFVGSVFRFGIVFGITLNEGEKIKITIETEDK